MNILLKLCLVLFFIANTSYSQNYSTYFVGHSLVGHTMPDMLNQLAQSQGVNYSSKRQIINGAPLKYNWENPQQGEVGNYTVDLSTGNYNTLILTEAIPLDNHVMWSDTHIMANNFYNYFNTYATNGVSYIYETWHCINSGTATGCNYDNGDDVSWRERITQDLSTWENIINYINTQNNTNTTQLIPAGQAMALLYDEIALNNLNGITSLTDFYTDDIHLNDYGNYYIACVMYATLFNKTPVGLTRNINDTNGTPYNTPNPTLANQLQELALESVCNYQSNTANACQILNIETKKDDGDLSVYTNSESVNIVTKKNTITTFSIYNTLGVNIKTKSALHKNKISIKKPYIKNGVYILVVTLSTGEQKSKIVIL